MNDKLNGLMAAYRDACPDVEPSPQFMPNLWKRIEARRVDTTFVFRRLAHLCVAATAVAVVALLASAPSAPLLDGELISRSYTEVLAADHADQAYIQVLTADVPGLIR